MSVVVHEERLLFGERRVSPEKQSLDHEEEACMKSRSACPVWYSFRQEVDGHGPNFHLTRRTRQFCMAVPHSENKAPALPSESNTCQPFSYPRLVSTLKDAPA
ncbi:uncharacterized protein UTRI_04083 [Ustilago trichophora]|uniref:Uncharacterized protein n=1 Tax=Ustilago trichophora TaxID=86804 RepID=A0A5C3E6Z2_9BASI|nr:uncharacterized protein UTRI_04083 [Ustilago trichophora]